MVVVADKDSRTDVVDKETGGPMEMSTHRHEMSVVVEIEDGSDVEEQKAVFEEQKGKEKGNNRW